MTRPPGTLVFFPEGAYGPTNDCVGIGDALRRRGHRVVFIVEESFKGALDTYGHEPAELRAAAERPLADASLHERLTSLSRRLRAAPGTARAADLIERAA